MSWDRPTYSHVLSSLQGAVQLTGDTLVTLCKDSLVNFLVRGCVYLYKHYGVMGCSMPAWLSGLPV